jgi:hypothetical protein
MNRTWRFVLIALAVTGCAAGAFFFFWPFGGQEEDGAALGNAGPAPGEQAKTAVPVVAAPAALSISQIQGVVQVRHGQGSWLPAQEGMVLEAQDSIRTDESARATLSRPGMFTVELDSGSDFLVRSLTENISRFMLESGMISANVAEHPERRFEVTSSAAQVNTSGALFKMSVNAQGLVVLGTEQGTVEVAAEGKVVKVGAGYLAKVEKGKAPEDPIRIPPQLFLKVRWPKQREFNTRSLEVSGRTAPGSRVRMEGAVVPVDSQGGFVKVLTLKEGRNQINVESYDVAGNRNRSDSPVLQVDTHPKPFQIQTSPHMWERKSP